MRKEFEAVIKETRAQAKLVTQFVTIFSRFEFALTWAGYVRKDSERAEPAWRRFADSLPVNLTELVEPPEVKSAISYLYQEPPMLLKRGPENLLEWTCQRPDKNNVSLFELVRTVRNNLFHGGKIPFTPGRDEKLLRSAIVVLSYSLDLDQRVYQAFCRELIWVAA